LSVDVALEVVAVDAYGEFVPVIEAPRRVWSVVKDGPGVDIGTIETGESEVSGTGIEAVVTITSVGMEDESCGALFVVESNGDADIEGGCGEWFLVQAECASAEGATFAAGEDSSGALFPVAAEEGEPESFVECADGGPAGHGDGVGFGLEAAEESDGDGEAEFVLEGRFAGDDTDDASLAVEHGTAAVAAFDGHGELEHFDAVDFLVAGDDPGDDRIAEAFRMSECNDFASLRGAIFECEGESGEIESFDAEDGEIELRRGSVNCGDGEFSSVLKFNANVASIANDVPCGGDKS
jgi:hypothetical protein